MAPLASGEMLHENRNSAAKPPVIAIQSETGNAPHRNFSGPYRIAPPADSRSVVQYWRILYRQKGLLLLSVLLMGLVAYLLTRMQAPVYRARTSIEIESLNQDFLNMRSVSPMTSTQGLDSPEYNIRTQTIVLQSTPVLERAIDKVDLAKRLVTNNERRRTWFWSKPTPALESGGAVSRNRAVVIAAAGLKVRPEPNTRVVEISFDSTDPQVAADMANSVAAAFSELNLDKRTQDSQNTREWLTRQLQHLRVKLEKSQDAAQHYARGANLTILSEKDNVAEDRLRQMQLEITRAQAERIGKQSRYELATTARPESLPEVLDDPALKDYQGQITTLRRQLADYSSTFTPNHPKVIKVKAELAAVETALERSRANILSRIRNEFDSSSRREALLVADYTQQVHLISNQSDKVTQYSLLRREAETTRQLYDSLVQRVTEAGLASAMRASDIHVIQPAARPPYPYKPNTALNIAFGILSGLCFGAALVILRAQTVQRIQKPGDTSLHLNVPELGVIPSSATESYSFRKLLKMPAAPNPGDDPERLELTTWKKWSSAMAESFRLTLVSILRSDVNDGRRPVIAISSATAGEGKTTVLSNLGIALAQIDCRVLLVDGDMRKPRLHEIFQVENTVGLSDALAGNAFVSGQKTAIPGLFVLPSGPQPDERLLFSSRLEKVLRRLKEQFDIILIDTPPLLEMSDARLIGIHTDAVILVVAQNTDRAAVMLAKMRLAEDGSHLLGAILNNWDPKTSASGAQYYNTRTTSGA
jgi:succinoglycan biosynthesis transport protein ExoP